MSVAIEARNLTVRYGSLTVLDDINFVLEHNCFLSIIGPNGAGKSTLLRVIMGLLSPNGGELTVLGQSPRNLPAGRLGYVPQVKLMDRSFPARVEELVVTGICQRWPGLGWRRHLRTVEQALGTVGAAHLMGRSVKDLSGGELQRVYLARALVGTPDLVVLDEPATGIDAGGEADMYQLLENYQRQQKASIVMITHDLNATYHLSSRVLLVQKTQIGYGLPQDVLSDSNLRRAFGHVGHDHGMLVASKEH